MSYNKEQIIRRRFYLSQGSLQFLDETAMFNGVSTSILLDDILREMRLAKELREMDKYTPE